eukprot:SAG31_NODE_4632_length_3084_cov_2.286767_1_plen_52_part_00
MDGSLLVLQQLVQLAHNVVVDGFKVVLLWPNVGLAHDSIAIAMPMVGRYCL